MRNLVQTLRLWAASRACGACLRALSESDTVLVSDTVQSIEQDVRFTLESPPDGGVEVIRFHNDRSQGVLSGTSSSHAG